LIKNLYRHIRIFIKETPILYSVIAKNLSDEARMVDKHTEIVIEGFQRSGNTFAWFLVKELYGYKVDIAHHTHSVANLKLAIKYNKKLIVIIRDPLDSLTSAAIYRCKDGDVKCVNNHIQFLIDDYKSFYIYLGLIKLKNNVIIYHFSSLVNNPLEFCNKISPVERVAHNDGQSISDIAINSQRIYESKKNISKHMSTQVNNSKNILKDIVKKHISSSYKKQLIELDCLYNLVD
jgi:hypothetical protein